LNIRLSESRRAEAANDGILTLDGSLHGRTVSRVTLHDAKSRM
jgi:hypothetical protein